jgi:hypothetical protein
MNGPEKTLDGVSLGKLVSMAMPTSENVVTCNGLLVSKLCGMVAQQQQTSLRQAHHLPMQEESEVG